MLYIYTVGPVVVGQEYDIKAFNAFIKLYLYSRGSKQGLGANLLYRKIKDFESEKCT